MIYFDNSATTQVLPEVLSTYNAVSENNYQKGKLSVKKSLFLQK